MSKMFVLLGVLFSVSAWAIDTAKCPSVIPLNIQITKVYKNSIYRNTPGWKEAQASLNSVDSIESRLKLVSKSSTACQYSDNDLGTAVLTTSEFQDPEEFEPSKVDQLVLSLKDGDSTFVSFIPVKAYSRNGFVLHQNPYSVKIKARLYFTQNNRWANIDMGMISVSSK